MNKLMKTGIILSFITIVLALAAPLVRADITIGGLPPLLDVTIRNVIDMILYLVGFIAVLFLIIGGFQYITASGNPDQLEGAKKTIMYSVIGIIVVVISWAIVYFITSRLGGGTPIR